MSVASETTVDAEAVKQAADNEFGAVTETGDPTDAVGDEEFSVCVDSGPMCQMLTSSYAN